MTRTKTRALANWPNNAVSVSDFGAVGDGVTDDTAAIQAAINAAEATGASLYFNGNESYSITKLTFTCPSVITSGCTFVQRDVSNTGSSCIDFDANIPQIVDSVVIETKASNTQRRAVSIKGDNLVINLLKVVCDARNIFSSVNDFSVAINGSYVTINNLWVENYDKACQIRSTSDGFITINRLDIVNYCQGVNIANGQNIHIVNSYIRGKPAGATWSKGYNGFLISGTEEDFGVKNITIENFTIEDSLEHAIRCSGLFASSNITFANFRIENTGGCGIKVCSYPTSGLRHKAVNITNGLMVDLGNQEVAKLKAGVMYYNAEDCNVSDVTVVNKAKDFSCEVGINLFNTENIQVSNCSVTKSENDAISLRATTTDDDGNPRTGASKNILVNGFITEECSSSVRINLELGLNHRRILFQDMLCRNSTSNEVSIEDARADDDESTISINDFLFQGTIINPSADPADIVKIDNEVSLRKYLMFQTTGTMWTNTRAANGSIQNTTEGEFLVLKDNTWYDILDGQLGATLTSPNGTRYRLDVANDGTISTTAT